MEIIRKYYSVPTLNQPLPISTEWIFIIERTGNVSDIYLYQLAVNKLAIRYHPCL